LMGWLGSPVYLTTAVLPVILVTVGLADEIHVFWHYQRRLAAAGAGETAALAVARTMDEMAAPVVLTSLTTGLAFLSFLASGIAPVRAFGLFAAVGVLYCLLSTLTAVPAALALLPPARFAHPRPGGPRRRGERLARILAPALARPGRTLAVLAAVTLALGAGVFRLAIQDSWLDGFAPGSALRRDTARVGAKLLGTHVLLIEVAFDPAAGAAVGRAGGREAPLLAPANLEAIGAFERFLSARPEVGGVLGPYSHAAAVHHLWLARREGTRSIPDRPERLDLLYRRFAQGRGEHRLREVFAPGLDRAVVTLYLGHANFRDTAALMAAARAWAGERLAPLGARIGFAGDVAVSQAMIPAIVRTQLASLALALAGVVAVVALLRRSLAEGLAVAAPVAAAVVWITGAMGWLGVPLGVATSTFCAIALGVGVDHAIHYREAWRRARAGGDPEPWLDAVRSAGPAIVTDAGAIALGFGLLALSRVPPNARLGVLVAAALLASAALTLAGLGAALAAREGWRRTRPNR